LQEAFDKGNEILGNEKWIDLWLQLLDRWKAETASNGLVVECVEAEENLRSQELPPESTAQASIRRGCDPDRKDNVRRS